MDPARRSAAAKAINLRTHRLGAISSAETAVSGILALLGDSPETQMAQLRFRETIFWAKQVTETAFALSRRR